MDLVHVLSPLALLLLAATTGAATFRRWRVLFKVAKGTSGKASRLDHISGRIWGLFVYVLGQGRLLRWPFSGVLHALIFWGFVILMSAILQGIVEAIFVDVQWQNFPLAGLIALMQDVFWLLVVTGVVMAVVNRLVFKPHRFLASHRGDALLILLWIGTLVTFMQLDLATKIVQTSPVNTLSGWRPLASLLSHLFVGDSATTMQLLHGIFFWGHLSLVFGFLAYLGYSKHLHIITSTFNVFFRNLEPKGALPTLDLDAETDHYGVSAVSEFSWKDTLDLITCTECGRCTAHCPAYNTDKPLSPKTLITDLRDAVYEDIAGGYAATKHAMHGDVTGYAEAETHGRGALEFAGSFQPSWLTPTEVQTAVDGNSGKRPLFGGIINEETLWSCTTCGACMDQCPVLIEHVPKIIDMRRSLVLEAGRMPKGAEQTLRNIETQGNPYGLPHQTRADWAKDLGIKTIAENPGAEYLYWVGCAASFDQRAQGVAVAMIKIMQAAKLDFAILGLEEKCTGDPARRIGNEYLFQERAKENVATLNKHNVKKIIATCPHCFNTIGNEYDSFGGKYEVIHHTQLIHQLLASGRLVLKNEVAETVTYHDSCYLGRWNDIFAPPRETLERIPGLRLIEMARSKSEGMCCGAGGGKMWFEETQPRVNHARVQQAVDTGATKVSTACPFCLAMFDEGISSKQIGETLAVDDVAIYVARSLGETL